MSTWLGVALVLLSALASAHVILHKRDARAAISWVGLIWLAPGIGALLYVILGVNRIRRRAIALGRARRRALLPDQTGEATAAVAAVPAALAGLARLGAAVSGRPLLAGNGVTPLRNGEEAYPAMLDAIEQAATSVTLSTYIFAADDIGRRFVDALARAVRRGVEVRVLVDGAGVGYSRPPIHHVLRRAGVRAALFLPVRLGRGLAFFNLRNHRKILVCDGRVGFSGGMNIRDLHMAAVATRHTTRDVHFRVEGPVVQQLQEVFAEDWAFATREVLDGPVWFPPLDAAGPIAARVLSGGPDVDFEVARSVLLGALAAARESVAIVTPYFLPDQSMIAALAVTALRGVRVDIVLPERGNIPLVRWAARAQLWQVLARGCRVFLSPAPFDHAKLLVVDGGWVLVGSSNWDSRSLRLNFELDIECHDHGFAARVDELVAQRRALSREITLRDMDARPLPLRLRDGIARLLSPYL
jgi:cardiolipin synthase